MDERAGQTDFFLGLYTCVCRYMCLYTHEHTYIMHMHWENFSEYHCLGPTTKTSDLISQGSQES